MGKALNDFQELTLAEALAVFAIILIFFVFWDDDDYRSGIMRPVRQKANK